MTDYSTIAGLPLPEDNDILVAQQAFGDYALALDTMLIPQYTTVAARNTAMSSGKVAGMLCAVAGELQWWDGSAWWNFGDTRYVVKAAATTRASTTTLTPDPDLVIPLTPGRWAVEAHLLFSGGGVTTTNASCSWDSSGGTITSASRTVLAIAAGAADRNNALASTPSPGMGTAIATGTSGSTTYRQETLLLDVTTADTLRFNWAQGTSSATGLTLGIRSHLSYRMVYSA